MALPYADIAFAVCFLIGLVTLFVGKSIVYVHSTRTLPGRVATWATPIILFGCCATSMYFSWTQSPKALLSFWLVGGMAAIILLVVYLYRWEVKNHY